MDAQSYANWCEVSGLYLDNVSHGDRYKTYSQHLSNAGLNTVIVQDFLKDNQAELNVSDWRNYSVYEMAGDLRVRIELTAEALRTIGAHRIADAVQTSQSSSPFDLFKEIEPSDPGAIMDAFKDVNPMDMMKQIRESAARMMPEMAAESGFAPEHQSTPLSEDGTSPYETRPEVELLLKEYVTSHQKQLLEDLKKHGDPRNEPGYTREGRLEELDDAVRKKYRLETQREDLEKFEKLMESIPVRYANPEKLDRRGKLKLEQDRRTFLDLVGRNREQAAESPLPEMCEMLDKAASFIDNHPAIFLRKPTEDDELNKQLAAIGDYDVEDFDDLTQVSWRQPEGLKCDWSHFSLTLSFPSGQPEVARGTLQVIDRLKRQIPELAQQWRQELIDHFRNFEMQMSDWELEDYDMNDDEQITEESILANVGRGTIFIEGYDEAGEDVSTHVWFDVEWDEEHGCELYWEDELPEAELEFDASVLTNSACFSEAGPVLTPEQIELFERQFSMKLPETYRQFLLQQNGGVPEPRHFLLRQQGTEFPLDVKWFYSISAGNQSFPDERSLEEAITSSPFPESVIPIADADVSVQTPYPQHFKFYLMLSGKNAGRIMMLAEENPMMQMPGVEHAVDPAAMKTMMAHMIDSSPAVARDVFEFVSKLKTRPEEDLPEWLSFIRNDEREQFTHWLENGGKLQTVHTGYGDPIPKSVLDFLTLEGSVALIDELLQRKAIKPGTLCASWERYSIYNIDRFRELMPFLPKVLWPRVFNSPQVWNHPELWEELASAGVNIDDSIDDEGGTPLHKAVQAGHQEAVKWLLAHGADPHKDDKYRRNAFLWAESGPGYNCLPLLGGKAETGPARAPNPDDPGLVTLTEEAVKLPAGTGLVISIQITSPPVTRIEKTYYPDTGIHYRLTIDVRGRQVTFNDMRSARQDYLFAQDWPTFLFAPILQWPELTPLWETLEVREFDWNKAMKKRNYEGVPRDDLTDAARGALDQAFDPEEAAARRIKLKKM